MKRRHKFWVALLMSTVFCFWFAYAAVKSPPNNSHDSESHNKYGSELYSSYGIESQDSYDSNPHNSYGSESPDYKGSELYYYNGHESYDNCDSESHDNCNHGLDGYHEYESHNNNRMSMQQLQLDTGKSDIGAYSTSIEFVKVNGLEVDFPDGQPMIKNNRTLVPVRFIAEALGYDVEWAQDTKTVLIDRGRIALQIGSNSIMVDGELFPLDVPAELITVEDSTRTYVPLRFIAENLNTTVDWFDANRCIVIYPVTDTGEESLYVRLKDSDLFYERVYSGRVGNTELFWDPEWNSCLFLKSALEDLSDEACVDADWFISRNFTWYPTGNMRENGQDIEICFRNPGLEARRQVKRLLRTFYETGYEEVYDLLMLTAREEIFENYSPTYPSICGTYGNHYFDNREVHVVKLFSTMQIVMHIKNKGYVNSERGYIPTPEENEMLLANSRTRQEGGKSYLEEYQLDIR